MRWRRAFSQHFSRVRASPGSLRGDFDKRRSRTSNAAERLEAAGHKVLRLYDDVGLDRHEKVRIVAGLPTSKDELREVERLLGSEDKFSQAIADVAGPLAWAHVFRAWHRHANQLDEEMVCTVQ